MFTSAGPASLTPIQGCCGQGQIKTELGLRL